MLKVAIWLYDTYFIPRMSYVEFVAFSTTIMLVMHKKYIAAVLMFVLSAIIAGIAEAIIEYVIGRYI